MSESKETLKVVLQDPKFVQKLGEAVEAVKNDDVVPVEENYFE